MSHCFIALLLICHSSHGEFVGCPCTQFSFLYEVFQGTMPLYDYVYTWVNLLFCAYFLNVVKACILTRKQRKTKKIYTSTYPPRGRVQLHIGGRNSESNWVKCCFWLEKEFCLQQMHHYWFSRQIFICHLSIPWSAFFVWVAIREGN